MNQFTPAETLYGYYMQRKYILFCIKKTSGPIIVPDVFYYDSLSLRILWTSSRVSPMPMMSSRCITTGRSIRSPFR